MCRSIKPLFNFKPTATQAEIQAASAQYVKKVSGFTKPSAANQAAYNQAVNDIAIATQTLLNSLITTAPPRDREIENAKAKARSIERFGGI